MRAFYALFVVFGQKLKRPANEVFAGLFGIFRVSAIETQRRVRDSNPRYLSVQQFFPMGPQSPDRRNLGNSICLKPIISINGFEELLALKCHRLRFKFFMIVQTKWGSRLRALNQPVIVKLQSSL